MISSKIPFTYKAFILYCVPIVAYCFLLFYLSSLKSTGVSHDKTAHFLAYGGLSFLVMRTLVYFYSDLSGKVIFLAFLLSTLYGISDEIHQYYVPGRDCSGWDVLVDAIGSFLGALSYVFFTFLRRKFSKV